MMVRYAVCKTVVAYPNKPQFVTQLEADPHGLRAFESLPELAGALRRTAPRSNPPQEPRYIKNDVPGDIVWLPNSGDTVARDTVTEYERLSRDEVRELARLLRQ